MLFFWFTRNTEKQINDYTFNTFKMIVKVLEKSNKDEFYFF